MLCEDRRSTQSSQQGRVRGKDSNVWAEGARDFRPVVPTSNHSLRARGLHGKRITGPAPAPPETQTRGRMEGRTGQNQKVRPTWGSSCSENALEARGALA